MSKLRSVSTSFWSDPWVETLTPNQKLLFLYLITNEKTNMLGIYEASIKKISFETGIPEGTVSKDLKAFESLGKVRYLKNFVVLTNFIKHQNYNPNMKKAAVSIYSDLPQDVKIQGLILDESKPFEAFESLCKGLGMVRKVEVEYELEDELKEEESIACKPQTTPDLIDFFAVGLPMSRKEIEKPEAMKIAARHYYEHGGKKYSKDIWDKFMGYWEALQKNGKPLWMKQTTFSIPLRIKRFENDNKPKLGNHAAQQPETVSAPKTTKRDEYGNVVG